MDFGAVRGRRRGLLESRCRSEPSGLPDGGVLNTELLKIGAVLAGVVAQLVEGGPEALHALGIEVGRRGNIVWDKGLPLRGLGLLPEVLLGLLDKLGTDKKFDRGHGLSFRSGGRAFVGEPVFETTRSILSTPQI